jgi:hypothetical protein
MKISKFLTFCFFFLCFILPYIALAHAADKPRYVGVNEDQEFVWNTAFDKDPIESYIEDSDPTATEQEISDDAHAWFDFLEYDEDAVKWKVVVTDIDDEDEDDYEGENLKEKDINRVKLTIRIYDQEEGAEWDDVDKSEKYKIYEPEERVYADMVIESLDDTGFGLGSMTLVDDTPIDYDVEWPCFFVPKNLHYDDIGSEVEDELEGDLFNRDDHYDVGTEDVTSFFRKKDVGLSTTVESGNTQVEDFDAVIKFTDEGIMYYYEWSYDGDPIALFELDTIGGDYLIENWWWIALIAGAVIIGVIIIVVVIAAKRR